MKTLRTAWNAVGVVLALLVGVGLATQWQDYPPLTHLLAAGAPLGAWWLIYLALRWLDRRYTVRAIARDAQRIAEQVR